MGRLAGKVAIITGAASGMGLASARRFAQEGARLVLADVDRPALDTAVAGIAAAGGEAIAVAVDVSRAADVERMVATAVERFGGLDICFNNAGIEADGARLAHVSEESWDRVIAVDLKGVFLGMKYAIPAMLARGGGSVVNTASAAGLVGWPRGGAYSAAKGGVVALTKAAALDYAKDLIRVNAICPGVIYTAMSARLMARTPGRTAEDNRARQPLPLIGQAEDVAEMALYLASDESRFVTGTAMSVDGGYTAR